ncbi:GNAT family N-acetyltransferase [Devosia sp. YIM 151766]|uniref:GNAT family N-acetyltransferase n=1 Tax=Devosia sp. YIM 151766 TaxID=3017325 RepID=UPI00255C6DCD|nr:GNAT family N-acetyltransferase [Devosia sp. YIM 151766]WIY54401.1 GNAT family N-acetyltransferase [Devosia sp. YIM 151766]
MPEQAYTATIHPSSSAIPEAVWNGLVPATAGIADNPFLDHAFFRALEESGCATGKTGWQPQHILLSDQTGQPVGLLPLFLKSHSMGEYVFDHGWANALERAGGHYYPKLQGSVPFTPATAPKLLVPSGSLQAQAALLQTAQQLATRLDASSVHLTFLPEPEAELAGSLDWLRRTDTQFHWHNRDYASFEHFLETLSSRKRKTIRRERRDALADGLTVRWLTGRDIEERHWDAFFDFYEDTGARKWGRPYLNRAFFSLLGQYMADSVVLMLAYDGNEPIAGAINFRGRDRLYGRNWGAVRDVPFLHFEICYYQAIDYAIAHQLAVVEAGAQGEHKLARGYEPVSTHSVHWIAHPGLRHAIADYLEDERSAVERQQEMLETFTPFRKGERQER